LAISASRFGAVAVYFVGHFRPRRAAGTSREDDRVHAVAHVGREVGQIARAQAHAVRQPAGVGAFADQRRRLVPLVKKLLDQMQAGLAGCPGNQDVHAHGMFLTFELLMAAASALPPA